MAAHIITNAEITSPNLCQKVSFSNMAKEIPNMVNNEDVTPVIIKDMFTLSFS